MCVQLGAVGCCLWSHSNPPGQSTVPGMEHSTNVSQMTVGQVGENK